MTILPTISCYGATAVGYIMQETILPTRIERAPLNYMDDFQNYTSGIGGVTFNYPVGWFTQAPIVQISVQQNVPHATNLAYVVEVSANSTTSTTVMVYQVSSGFVSEATTGAISICLLAIDNPL